MSESGRFVPRPRVEPTAGAPGSIDRLPAVKAELETILRDIELIVARGEQAFLSEDDRTNYLAGSALIIHFDDIAQRRISGEIKNRLADVPWQQITATGNILARNYSAADKQTIWLALAGDLPRLIRMILQG